MTQENESAPTTIHYFVDEAGDPTLFNAKGKIIVGNEGCSKHFIMGKLDVDEPAGLTAALEKLREELLADPYFKGSHSTPVGNAGLQAVDYFLWALQRFYQFEHTEKRESECRYIEMIYGLTSEINDLDCVLDGKRGVIWGPTRPLTLAVRETKSAKKKPGI